MFTQNGYEYTPAPTFSPGTKYQYYQTSTPIQTTARTVEDFSSLEARLHLAEEALSLSRQEKERTTGQLMKTTQQLNNAISALNGKEIELQKYKAALEMQNAEALELQRQLTSTHNAFKGLQTEHAATTSSLESMNFVLESITGSSEVERIVSGQWYVPDINSVTLKQLSSRQIEEVPDNARHVSAEASKCLGHHCSTVAASKYLSEYISSCIQSQQQGTDRSKALVKEIEAQQIDQLKWLDADWTVDISSECNLQTDISREWEALQNTDDDDSVLGKMVKRLKEIQQQIRTVTGENDILSEEVKTIQQIQSLARQQVHIRPCKDVLRSVIDSLEQILLGTPWQERFASIDEQIHQLKSSINAVVEHQTQCEREGDIASVEREVTQKLRLNKYLMERVQKKLEILEDDSNDEPSYLHKIEQMSQTAKECIDRQQLHHSELRSSCLADIARITHSMKAKQPKVQTCKEETEQKMRQFERAISDNDKEHEKAWCSLANGVAAVVKASQKREELVQNQLAAQATYARHLQAHEAFEQVVTQHISQLKNMCGTCDLVGRVYSLLDSFVDLTTNVLLQKVKHRNVELSTNKELLHKEFYVQFFDWFLTQGEYAHKKTLVLKDIHKQVEQVREQKRVAVERLDTLASVHAETERKLESQKAHLEALVPRLHQEQDEALVLFEATKCYFTEHSIEYVHPMDELQKRNTDREVQMQTRELAQSQELVMSLQQSLLSYESKKDVSTISSCPSTPAPDTASTIGGEGGDTTIPDELLSPTTVNNEEWTMATFKKRLQEELIIIPQQYLDPITMEIMEEPVMAADGHTYDKNSIMRWFTKRKQSPITNVTLCSTDLVTNLKLAESLQQWVQENCQALEVPVPSKTRHRPVRSTTSTPVPYVSSESTVGRYNSSGNGQRVTTSSLSANSPSSSTTSHTRSSDTQITSRITTPRATAAGSYGSSTTITGSTTENIPSSASSTSGRYTPLARRASVGTGERATYSNSTTSSNNNSNNIQTTITSSGTPSSPSAIRDSIVAKSGTTVRRYDNSANTSSGNTINGGTRHPSTSTYQHHRVAGTYSTNNRLYDKYDSSNTFNNPSSQQPQQDKVIVSVPLTTMEDTESTGVLHHHRPSSHVSRTVRDLKHHIPTAASVSATSPYFTSMGGISPSGSTTSHTYLYTTDDSSEDSSSTGDDSDYLTVI